MPRAPHSSALLAGSPRAKRSVLVSRGSRMRSMPLSSERGTRLTSATGMKPPGEGVACREVRRFGLLRAKALDGPSDPFEHTRERFLKVHVAPVAKAGELAIVAPPSRDKRPVGRRKGQRAAFLKPSKGIGAMTGFAYAQAAPGAFDYLNSLIVPTMLIIGIMYFL